MESCITVFYLFLLGSEMKVQELEAEVTESK